jgi:hypothetical protein
VDQATSGLSAPLSKDEVVSSRRFATLRFTVVTPRFPDTTDVVIGHGQSRSTASPGPGRAAALIGLVVRLACRGSGTIPSSNKGSSVTKRSISACR